MQTESFIDPPVYASSKLVKVYTKCSLNGKLLSVVNKSSSKSGNANNGLIHEYVICFVTTFFFTNCEINLLQRKISLFDFPRIFRGCQ